MNSTGSLTWAVVYANNSSRVGSLMSPTPTIRSPGWMPAADAGPTCPFSVVSTDVMYGVGVRGSPKKNSQLANRIAATTKCDPGPARITIARCRMGLAP